MNVLNIPENCLDCPAMRRLKGEFDLVQAKLGMEQIVAKEIMDGNFNPNKEDIAGLTETQIAALAGMARRSVVRALDSMDERSKDLLSLVDEYSATCERPLKTTSKTENGKVFKTTICTSPVEYPFKFNFGSIIDIETE